MAVQGSATCCMDVRSWSVIFLLGVCSCTNTPVLEGDSKEWSGEYLYSQNCSICHGEDGDLGVAGAKLLSQSKLTTQDVMKIIKNGVNTMPPFEGKITDEEMERIETHIQKLRK